MHNIDTGLITQPQDPYPRLRFTLALLRLAGRVPTGRDFQTGDFVAPAESLEEDPRLSLPNLETWPLCEKGRLRSMRLLIEALDLVSFYPAGETVLTVRVLVRDLSVTTSTGAARGEERENGDTMAAVGLCLSPKPYEGRE
ncbi:hypothetical protein CMQ_5154 [Grosmannia clavigera kw1407]|uniref:Uncharacterized protein n=1 Tax=Grosmannia clavigera (strain kw1407 / UAMH 11150) TaxID=655863 RepID=F0XBQ6_GROCL|nr:uncharacterized protein CMQ_5154 [Grosmannia clavigera kw1407]EFX04892.1 hypothetical protein CMQ_5154 [Grosmannia clavigera kw1407]